MMERGAQHLTAFEPTTSWLRDVHSTTELQSQLTNDSLEMLTIKAYACRGFWFYQHLQFSASHKFLSVMEFYVDF